MSPSTRPPLGLHYGPLPLATRYLLSPLAGFTNLPFRRVIRTLGGLGLATTDLVNARGLLAGSVKTAELVETTPDDTPLAVQIFGHEPEVLAAAAQLLESRGTASIDINMGCPVQHVTKTGAGAGLMCAPEPAVRLVEAVVRAVRIPVTVKMRLGWDAAHITAPDFARAFEDVGVAAIAIHGRTREQGFSGQVDRTGIRRVVAAVRRIPVIGNGDIRTVADAARMFDETGCAGISIGRGALANPWIFAQLVAWETTGTFPPAGNFDDRLHLMGRQFDHLVELQGPVRAVPSFRRMAHWYLKGMRVSASLRNEFQQANTLDEARDILARIAAAGPQRGYTREDLPDLQIPVPAGPQANW